MKKILVSTDRRHTPSDQPSGHLAVYDLESQKVERNCEIIEPPYRDVDPNPRGGLRGLKGISIRNNPTSQRSLSMTKNGPQSVILGIQVAPPSMILPYWMTEYGSPGAAMTC
jgi:hypothetical protein